MIAERRSLFSSWQLVVVPLILMAAFALRIWGIDFGLPNTLARPDETTLVHRALAIGAGDLNPHFFRYPSLHFYVLALVYGLYFLAGRATGHFDGVEDFQYEFFAEPSTIFILGRLLSAMMGTASVALVYSIATRWRGRTAGVLSALFLAVAFLHVRDSHFLTLDVPATFYLLVACLFAWRQFDQPNTRTALLSGLFLGLATSTKYNVVLLAPMILLAVAFSSRGHQHGSREAAGLHLGSPQLNSKGSWTLLAMTTLVAIVAFVAGSPFVLLDYSTFLADLTAEGGQFSVGRALDLGRGWTYHLHTSLVHGLGWPLLITSAAGCLFLLQRRTGRDLAFLGGLLTYYLVAGSGKSVYLRYMVPMVPLLCITAGVFLATITHKLHGAGRYGVLLGIGLLVAAPTALDSWHHSSLLARPDTRQLAAQWVAQHIPAGSTLALAGSTYGYPRLNRSRRWLEHARDDQRRSGYDADRLSLMLALEGFPPEPSYYVVELRSDNPQGMRSVLVEEPSAQTLRRAGVDWVVIQEHPLPFSQLTPALRQVLHDSADLVVSFDPFVAGAVKPPFDPIDAFYAPIAEFSSVRFGGPIIRIYRFHQRL